MLKILDDWLRPAYRRVWEAIYRMQAEGGHSALAEARAQLAMHGCSEDERRALGHYLDFLQHQLEFYFRSEEEGDGAALLSSALSELGRPLEGELTRMMQARIMLTLASFAHARGASQISAAQMDAWRAAVPPGGMDHQSWNYLSFWAFSEGRRDLLTEAYRFYLLEPVDFMVDFSRQRIKTLLALSESRCLKSDLARCVELLPNPLHSEWMRWFLLPVLSEQGLWDRELESALQQKERELSLRPEVPPSAAQRERLRGNI